MRAVGGDGQRPAGAFRRGHGDPLERDILGSLGRDPHARGVVDREVAECHPLAVLGAEGVEHVRLVTQHDVGALVHQPIAKQVAAELARAELLPTLDPLLLVLGQVVDVLPALERQQRLGVPFDDRLDLLAALAGVLAGELHVEASLVGAGDDPGGEQRLVPIDGEVLVDHVMAVAGHEAARPAMEDELRALPVHHHPACADDLQLRPGPGALDTLPAVEIVPPLGKDDPGGALGDASGDGLGDGG